MSNTPASLRRKINRAGDLQSVVRTMKALAASSIGQYEQSGRALLVFGCSKATAADGVKRVLSDS
jgi:F0F1-type ATP synthase gamma subunit